MPSKATLSAPGGFPHVAPARPFPRGASPKGSRSSAPPRVACAAVDLVPPDDRRECKTLDRAAHVEVTAGRGTEALLKNCELFRD